LVINGGSNGGLLVTAVTVASSAPLSQMDQSPLLLKKNAADINGYFVATRSGLAMIISLIISIYFGNRIKINKIC
jgi:hypothetical protein